MQAAPDDLIVGAGLPEFPKLPSDGSVITPLPRPAAENDSAAETGPSCVETGMLLLAHPLLGGQPFSRSLVLVLAHDAERGSMGIVVNRATEMRCNKQGSCRHITLIYNHHPSIKITDSG
jgi:hypothetical protein